MGRSTITYDLFDVVPIPEGVPELNIEAGTRGAVIHVYKPDEAVCVEVVDEDGDTIALVDLHLRTRPRVVGYSDERD